MLRPCFYLQNELRVRGKNDINMPKKLPLDLAIESDLTSSYLNKFNIYASLGVPELWRYRKEALEVYVLAGGEYQSSWRSLGFELLPLAEIPNSIQQSKSVRAFGIGWFSDLQKCYTLNQWESFGVLSL